ncbi:MAG TPA: SMC-Scp complex subunit ScpB [Actinomycetota bacterium]
MEELTIDRALLRDLEAILFVADEPLTTTALAQLLESERPVVEAHLRRLAESLEARDAGITLRDVAGGWRLYTNGGSIEAVERFVRSSRHTRFTRASLETLSIVAYKQPVTRHQVSAIRGVNSDGVLRALIDRGLLTEVGRDDAPGRPSLFGTTPEFLERMGLSSVGDLPSLAPLLDEGADDDEVASLDDAPDDAVEDVPGEPEHDRVVDLSDADDDGGRGSEGAGPDAV